VLKSLEGCVMAVKKAFVDAIASVADGAHAVALQPVIDPLVATLDPDTYGGAVLLGVDGVCVISHGSTGATAMLNGIRVAEEMVASGLVDELRRAVQSTTPDPQ
jgi:glycerol-3-phosphate acyltransferase PlsX